VLEHEGAHLLAVHAQALHRGGAGPDEVAHRLVALVGHPHGRELAGAQQAGQGGRVPAVGLDPVARLPRDERGRDHDAGVAEVGDEAVETVAGRAGLVAKVDALVLGREALHEPAHALRRRIDLSEEAHLAATLTVGDRHGVALLGDVDPDENLCRPAHGSPSCAEDRLGHPEQPSASAV
jgi:hypothetical protein